MQSLADKAQFFVHQGESLYVGMWVDDLDTAVLQRSRRRDRCLDWTASTQRAPAAMNPG